MKWDLNEEWVRRAIAAGFADHASHGWHGWTQDDRLIVACRCRTYLSISPAALEATRWHDEDEKRDHARENPREPDWGERCRDLSAQRDGLCSELEKTRTERDALSEALRIVAERNAELEDEVPR